MVKEKKRFIMAFCYVISLLPVFLPWCYFDKEMDGINYGTDIVNHVMLGVLAGITFLCIIFVQNQRGRMVTNVLLIMHPVIYLAYGLFWYVPLLTDFNLRLSLEAAHYGFYLSLLCSSLMYLFYIKMDRKHSNMRKRFKGNK